jgi:lipoyl(octanoyl) transferase
MLGNIIKPRSPNFLLTQWRVAENLIAYPDALKFMEQRVQEIRTKDEQELVWLLEHPSLYTAGTSAKPDDILDRSLCPIYSTGRGGQVTYHGPGQRIAYLMLDLQKRKLDIHAYVRILEQWLINTLNEFGIQGECREDRVGVWVVDPQAGTENKIAAIGIRVRKWVTFHGIALNVNPDLSYYQGIVPCGVREHGVTSMHHLGVNVSMMEVDTALKRHFNSIVGAERLCLK